MYLEIIDLPTRPGIPTLQRGPAPGTISFAVSFAAYIEKVTGTCPLCGHGDDAKVSDGEENEID
jgi:hypothetical protein